MSIPSSRKHNCGRVMLCAGWADTLVLPQRCIPACAENNCYCVHARTTDDVTLASASRTGRAFGLPPNCWARCTAAAGRRSGCELLGRLFDEGHALGHIVVQGRRVVLVLDGHDSPVALAAQLGQHGGVIGLSLS
jgi:hypothetical protein